MRWSLNDSRPSLGAKIRNAVKLLTSLENVGRLCSSMIFNILPRKMGNCSPLDDFKSKYQIHQGIF